MANCYFCGKKLGLLDSTTYYLDANGSKVEVHSECLRRNQSASSMQTVDPTMYAVEQEGTVSLSETLANTSPAAKYLMIGGALVVGVLIVGALFGADD